MPMMVSKRSHVLSTLSGHVVRFKKDEPVFVPPMVVRDALAVGAMAVDEEEQKLIDKKLDGDATTEPKVTEPTGKERDDKITEALEKILLRGNRNDFMANNRPRMDTIKAELGFEIKATERDRLWDALMLKHKNQSEE